MPGSSFTCLLHCGAQELSWRWDRAPVQEQALFLSCLLPRANPGSTLAHSGCKAAMNHLLKTPGTAVSLACKSLEVTTTEPPSALGTAALGAPDLLSLVHWSPGWISQLSYPSRSCKSPFPQDLLFLVPWQRRVWCRMVGELRLYGQAEGRGRGTPAHREALGVL